MVAVAIDLAVVVIVASVVVVGMLVDWIGKKEGLYCCLQDGGSFFRIQQACV